MAEQKFAYKESLRVGMLLAGTAGYIDSYTFAFHTTIDSLASKVVTCCNLGLTLHQVTGTKQASFSGLSSPSYLARC